MRKHWFPLCLAAGIALGVAVDTLTVWIAVGVALGIAADRRIHGPCP